MMKLNSVQLSIGRALNNVLNIYDIYENSQKDPDIILDYLDKNVTQLNYKERNAIRAICGKSTCNTLWILHSILIEELNYKIKYIKLCQKCNMIKNRNNRRNNHDNDQ